jgi:hypothetical protein
MKNSKRKQALIAGISLIIMALAAIFAYGYVLTRIEIAGDPVATWDQLTENTSLYIAGLGGWVIIFITDLLVTFSLFYFYRDTRKNLSLVTAATRFVYTLILGIAIGWLFSLIPVLNESDMDSIRAGNQALQAIDKFHRIWSLGLIIFGLHLFGLGYLSILNVRIPNIFGYLLLLAGLGYLVVHISKTLPIVPSETVDLMESILMLPMALGEILFAIWLIVKGGKQN